jgi:hypothetical protein
MYFRQIFELTKKYKLQTKYAFFIKLNIQSIPAIWKKKLYFILVQL